MKTKQIVSLAVFTGIIFFAALGVGGADLYVESEQVSQGVPGQPAGTKIIKQYLGADATMTDMEDRITIIDLKEKVLYDLDKAAKTYTKNPIEKMGQPVGAAAEDEEIKNNPMFKAMMSSMAQSVKVTATNETKKIAGYTCKKFNVTVMMTNSEYWVTKDFKGYDEMKVIGEKSAQLFEQNPMMKQMNIMGMMKELDGLPVRTITKVMNGTITTTLTKTENKKLDQDLFKVPKGYKQVKEHE